MEKEAMTLQRMEEFFRVLRGITESEKGITRLAFSDKDWETRAYVKGLMGELGLTIIEDAFGNYRGRLEGKDNTLPPILVGSHMDSVPEGGNYDGPAGVFAVLELVRRFKEKGFVPEGPIEAVVFMSEESARFGAATLGSRAFIGDLTQEQVKVLKDKQGHSLEQVLLDRGFTPSALGKPLYEMKPKAFFEVHIEQGKVLEHEGKQIGVVTGIAAPCRFRLIIKGKADHSGATPMLLRQDALCGAAEIILALEEQAKEEKTTHVVGTIGVMEAKPGAMNVIPGEVQLGVDIRSISEEARTSVKDNFLNKVEGICKERHLTFELIPIGEEAPVAIEANVQKLFTKACEEAGVNYLSLPSGAGHDAMYLAQIAPTGMLFVPCKEGISHNAEEAMNHEDLLVAIQILEKIVKDVSRKAFHL